MMKPMFMNVILMVVIVVHPIQLWIFACSANVMVINYDLLAKRNFNNFISIHYTGYELMIVSYFHYKMHSVFFKTCRIFFYYGVDVLILMPKICMKHWKSYVSFQLFGQIWPFRQYWNCRAKAKVCYFWAWFFQLFMGKKQI